MNNRVVFVEGRPDERGKSTSRPNATEMRLCLACQRVDKQMTFQTHLGLRHLGLTHSTTEAKIIRKGIGAKR
jgi:hypothetical protein